MNHVKISCLFLLKKCNFLWNPLPISPLLPIMDSRVIIYNRFWEFFIYFGCFYLLAGINLFNLCSRPFSTKIRYFPISFNILANFRLFLDLFIYFQLIKIIFGFSPISVAFLSYAQLYLSIGWPLYDPLPPISSWRFQSWSGRWRS